MHRFVSAGTRLTIFGKPALAWVSFGAQHLKRGLEAGGVDGHAGQFEPTRNHVAQLAALGYRVTLEPVA